MPLPKVRKDFLVYGSPRLEEPEIEEVVRTLRSGWIGTGPKVAAFERQFSAYKDNLGYPVAVNSCTAALHVSMIAAGLQPGDEVITTPMTFCATVNAIVHAGLTPVLADIDAETLNISPHEIARRITPRTKAILVVHFAGRTCDMDVVLSLAARHNLRVIEDCAHAVEATWRGRPAGTIGDFGCFSFYVTKSIITGEGGMVYAKNEANAARCKILALHGMSKDAWKRFGDDGYKHYEVVECGFKYNMMDLQASIGLHQLTRVEEYWQRRRDIWERYDRELAGLPIGTPAPPTGDSRHGLHLYTVTIDPARVGCSRDQFLTAMTEQNIGVGVHYQSIPEHPYYQRRFGWKPDDYPVARKVGRQTVSLPLTAKLTDQDVADVILAVRRIVERDRRPATTSQGRTRESDAAIHISARAR